MTQHPAGRRPRRRHAAARARKIVAATSASAFVAIGGFMAAAHARTTTASTTGTPTAAKGSDRLESRERESDDDWFADSGDSNRSLGNSPSPAPQAPSVPSPSHAQTNGS